MFVSKRKYEMLSIAYHGCSKEIKRLEAELAQAEKYQERFDELSAQVHSLDCMAENGQAEIIDLLKQSTDVKRMETDSKKISELTQQNTELIERLANTEEENTALAAKLKEAEAEKAKLHDALFALRCAIGDLPHGELNRVLTDAREILSRHTAAKLKEAEAREAKHRNRTELLDKALRELEWSNCDYCSGEHYCIVCDQLESQGHAADCLIKQALEGSEAAFDPPQLDSRDTTTLIYDEQYDNWECAKCDMVWHFDVDGPKENKMNYCPECGRKIVALEGGDPK